MSKFVTIDATLRIEVSDDEDRHSIPATIEYINMEIAQRIGDRQPLSIVSFQPYSMRTVD